MQDNGTQKCFQKWQHQKSDNENRIAYCQVIFSLCLKVSKLQSVYCQAHLTSTSALAELVIFSINPIQHGGGVYLPPLQDFSIFDRKTVSEGGESGM